MAEDWRRAITFSDRLSNTTEIISAYKTANPECHASEASTQAKAREELARKSAHSLEEYRHLINRNVQELLASAAPTPACDLYTNEHHFPNLPASGATIGRYTNAEHFNDGLFSEVYRALDPELPAETGKLRMVALKVTNPAVMQPPHDSIREARILEAATSEHVILLIETFRQSDGTFVLAFPYMPFNLDALLREQRMTPQSRTTIVKDMLSGLAHIHKLGIIHRDVKPSNILLATPSGPAYLSDFGISWSPKDHASEKADGKILDVGTTCYRPPELLFGYSSYGTKLDMWAAGCVAAQVFCLNSDTLFDAGDLGSELALIRSMFQTLGTPDLTSWPEAEKMPDWGKMNFTKYPGKDWSEILPEPDSDQRDLVKKLVQYESSWRLSADEALEHAALR
ncbi:Putative serine/threonine-protein kinase, active [Septoria linicola]|uniref:cyclin-dependent kinase n=1 Tax=Septoria linicola TaxID=215465 RepID=A0A9Q9B0X9_9PEZI|nr:Putative serine/threonine-protein kinase, active [Septoria linicola]